MNAERTPMISMPVPGAVGLCVIALALGSCGANPSPVAPLSTGTAPVVGSIPCASEGKRLIGTIEQRTSDGPAVARTVNHHDRLGRVTRVEIDADGDGTFEQLERYTYDEAGRLVELENADWIERYQLDREGCVAVREKQRKGSKLSVRAVLTHDRRCRLLRELSDLEDVRYTYYDDAREVHEQRTRPDQEVPYLSYVTTSDAAGRPLRQRGYDPDGPLHKTWTYDEHGREVQREWYSNGSLRLRSRMSYDAAGRRISEEHINDKSVVIGRESWTYDASGNEASHRTESFEGQGWVEERYSYTAPMKCRP